MEDWPLARQGETVARLGRDCTNETATYFSSIQCSSVGGGAFCDDVAYPTIDGESCFLFFLLSIEKYRDKVLRLVKSRTSGE